MASENKKKKLKNAFLVKSALKNKINRLKRLIFYTPAQRRVEKKFDLE